VPNCLMGGLGSTWGMGVALAEEFPPPPPLLGVGAEEARERKATKMVMWNFMMGNDPGTVRMGQRLAIVDEPGLGIMRRE